MRWNNTAEVTWYSRGRAAVARWRNTNTNINTNTITNTNTNTNTIDTAEVTCYPIGQWAMGIGTLNKN